MTGLSIIDVMDSPAGFLPWFVGPSWDPWKAVLKAAFALPMTPQELITFGELAGGRAPPKRRVRQFYCIAGRRCGKDSVAALLAVHAGTFEQGHLGKLRPGETAHIALVAVDRDQAGVLSSYIRSYFRQIPDLAQMVTRETRSGLELNNDVVISVQTNSFRQARGRTVLLCVLDELAFYRDENSQTPDIELHRAIMPSLMTLPNSMLVGISTPYRKAGLLHQMWKDHYGKDSDSVLVIQASSLQLNPLLDPAEIEAERAADPAAAVSEWDGQFRADLSSFVELELIESAVDQGVMVRPPRPGMSYVGFVDSATGVGTDSFAAAVAHKEGELIVCDVVYEKRPPFSAEVAFAEVAALFKAYGIEQAIGDKFGAGLTIEAAARYGLTYEYSELDRSQLYISTLPLFSSGRVRLVDNKRLVTQFASLERRTSAIGRDVVNHPNNRNDDAANACAGALTLAAAAGDDFLDEFMRAWSPTRPSHHEEAEEKRRRRDAELVR